MRTEEFRVSVLVVDLLPCPFSFPSGEGVDPLTAPLETGLKASFTAWALVCPVGSFRCPRRAASDWFSVFLQKEWLTIDEGFAADREGINAHRSGDLSANRPGRTRHEREEMSTTQTESRNETPRPDDLRREIQDLKREMEVQAATNAGAQATQAATHAGTWSTMLAGSGGLVVGLFLALAFSATRRK